MGSEALRTFTPGPWRMQSHWGWWKISIRKTISKLVAWEHNSLSNPPSKSRSQQHVFCIFTLFGGMSRPGAPPRTAGCLTAARRTIRRKLVFRETISLSAEQPCICIEKRLGWQLEGLHLLGVLIWIAAVLKGHYEPYFLMWGVLARRLGASRPKELAGNGLALRPWADSLLFFLLFSY